MVSVFPQKDGYAHYVALLMLQLIMWLVPHVLQTLEAADFYKLGQIATFADTDREKQELAVKHI